MRKEEVGEQWPARLQRKEIRVNVQKKVHKNTATAVSKAKERAVADLWKDKNLEVLCSQQRG